MPTQDLPVLHSLDEVVDVVQSCESPVYVRFSGGPDRDAGTQSVDYESDLPLPGLSVNPLRPPSWWRDHPVAEWVARQVCAYLHLKRDERRCWLLTGREVARGPDNEPLVADVEPLAWIDDAVLDGLDEQRSSSSRDEDKPDGGPPPWQSNQPA